MTRICCAFLLLLFALFGSAVPGCDTAPRGAKEQMKTEDMPAPHPVDVQGVMRAKTAWAAALLEAVAMRNYELVATNADALRRLSVETAFIVQDTVTYRAYSEQFRADVAQLAADARRGDQKAVESSYHRLTESCFHCHEYVRSEQFQSQMSGRVSMR